MSLEVGDKVVIIVPFGGELHLAPAYVVIVDDDPGSFTCRLYIPRNSPAPYGDKQRAVLYIEDEGISWMRGESPADAEAPFRVAAALGALRVELF